jgi:hypothetical protein
MTIKTFDESENNRGLKNKKELRDALRSFWLGWRDSNPRMLVPETSALPLGDTPITH